MLLPRTEIRESMLANQLCANGDLQVETLQVVAPKVAKLCQRQSDACWLSDSPKKYTTSNAPSCRFECRFQIGKKNCGKLGLAGGTRTAKIAYSCMLKFV